MKFFFIIPLVVSSFFVKAQVLWDFVDPINVAENTFGNTCAQLLIDPNGNPQIIRSLLQKEKLLAHVQQQPPLNQNR